MTIIIIAYLLAGLGFYGQFKIRADINSPRTWRSPINCILFWPATLIYSPFYGAFFGTLLNAGIAYLILYLISSFFS